MSGVFKVKPQIYVEQKDLKNALFLKAQNCFQNFSVPENSIPY